MPSQASGALLPAATIRSSVVQEHELPGGELVVEVVPEPVGDRVLEHELRPGGAVVVAQRVAEVRALGERDQAETARRSAAPGRSGVPGVPGASVIAC